MLRCLIATQQIAVDTAKRLQAARNFALEVARMAASTRCHNVAVLDVSRVSPVTDFFVIATGTSPRQMRSVCDDIAELGQSRDFKPMAVSDDNDHWLLADFIDVIFHVFSQDSRDYYDLDNLWGDAVKIDWHLAPSLTARPESAADSSTTA